MKSYLIIPSNKEGLYQIVDEERYNQGKEEGRSEVEASYYSQAGMLFPNKYGWNWEHSVGKNLKRSRQGTGLNEAVSNLTRSIKRTKSRLVLGAHLRIEMALEPVK